MNELQEYADKVLRLTIRLEQLSRGVSVDTRKIINKLQNELILTYSKIEKISSKKMLEKVRKRVKQLTDLRYEEIRDILEENAFVSAKSAIKAENSTFTNLGVVADASVAKMPVEKIIDNAYLNIMPSIGGRQISIGDMIESFIENGKRDVINITNRAYREGLSVPAITKMIKDSSGVQKNIAQSVARTTIQAVANEARDETAKQFNIEKEIWLATLDSKTCAFCQGLDGKCKPKGQLPNTLAHPNCRCVRLYVPKGMTCAEMKGDLSRIERGEDGKSRSMGKYQNYGEWIKTQPIEFQQEVLGKKRTKLLNDGKLTFNKMYTQDGKRRTIKNLEKHYGKIDLDKKVKLKKGQLAKTLEEVITPLETPTPSGVRLAGLSKPKQKQILEGLNRSVIKYGGSLNALKWNPPNNKSLASAQKKGDYISFNKEETLIINSSVKEDRKKFRDKKKANLKMFTDLKKGHDKGNIVLSAGELKFVEEGIEKYKVTKRWAVHTQVRNPLRAIATHEGFHNVYRMNKLEGAFRSNLQKHNVKQLDFYKVSEYGGSSESELFAEVGAAISEGVKIPENIEKAFNDTLKEIEK